MYTVSFTGPELFVTIVCFTSICMLLGVMIGWIAKTVIVNFEKERV